MKVFVTRRIPDSGLKLLKKQKGVTVEVYEKDKRITQRELLKRVKGADIILSILTENIDAKVMDAAGPQLKMIANYAVGFNNIDLKAADERGIVVTNAPTEEIGESVAEHAVALILGLAHRIVETDYFTRVGKYKSWGPMLLLGTDIRGKKLGIIGAGRIGTALATILHKGFGVEILYNNRSRNLKLEKKLKAKYRSKMQLLREADIVSLHVPLTTKTQHFISSKELAAMKKTAILINTSRGPVVDELALVKALTKGEIAGAGLDVYECEPLIDCNPKDKYELRGLANVILTPHTASATMQTRQAMSTVAAKNIIAFVSGKKVPNQII